MFLRSPLHDMHSSSAAGSGVEGSWQGSMRQRAATCSCLRLHQPQLATCRTQHAEAVICAALCLKHISAYCRGHTRHPQRPIPSRRLCMRPSGWCSRRSRGRGRGRTAPPPWHRTLGTVDAAGGIVALHYRQTPCAVRLRQRAVIAATPALPPPPPTQPLTLWNPSYNHQGHALKAEVRPVAVAATAAVAMLAGDVADYALAAGVQTKQRHAFRAFGAVWGAAQAGVVGAFRAAAGYWGLRSVRMHAWEAVTENALSGVRQIASAQQSLAQRRRYKRRQQSGSGGPIPVADSRRTPLIDGQQRFASPGAPASSSNSAARAAPLKSRADIALGILFGA